MADDTYKSGYYGDDMDQAISLAKNSLQKSGGTMTGALTLNGTPTSDNQAATKKYVDDAVKNVSSGGSGGTPNAVQYVPQELTDAQKAQARANIKAASDDWFLIADITTTEEVNAITVTQDAGGNNFDCSRVCMAVIYPNDISSSTKGLFFTIKGATGKGTYIVTHPDFSKPYYFFEVEIADSCFAKFKTFFSHDSVFNQTGRTINHTREFSEKTITRVELQRQISSDPNIAIPLFPTGTKIKVWGAKV